MHLRIRWWFIADDAQSRNGTTVCQLTMSNKINNRFLNFFVSQFLAIRNSLVAGIRKAKFSGEMFFECLKRNESRLSRLRVSKNIEMEISTLKGQSEPYPYFTDSGQRKSAAFV
jgi:hypothetical protein